MLQAVSRFLTVLDQRKINYDHYPAEEDRKERVRVDFSGDHVNNLTMVFFFDDDGESVNIKCFSICKVTPDKLMDIYVKLNELNYNYRWIKFYLDEDNEVTQSGDAIIDEETAGEECFELLGRYVNILDDCYPEIMKALWA